MLAGSSLSIARDLKLPLVFAAALLAVTAAWARPESAAAEGCAFPFVPTTYEDLKDRQLFIDTIELASFDMLFPGDPYFGLGEIEVGPREDRHLEPARVPPVLLKSIAWIESAITQAGTLIPFGSIGPALVSFDCGHGVTQLTTGMTVPEGELGRGSPEQALVATHFAYNIARGARVLVDKWNKAPEERPVAGTDTIGHPAVVENWYFAVWSYNGFTGPGATRSNHPMDPIYGTWPRQPYSCGPKEDGLGHNRALYPYQELVFGCATNPPEVDGEPLWAAQPVTLPDLNDRQVRSRLRLDNFVFPYEDMDIPTPKPLHVDLTPQPDPALREKILGSPVLATHTDAIQIPSSPDGSAAAYLHVFNTGSGVLAWYAVASVPWITITPYTGVAVGLDMPCEPDVPCDRFGHMALKVDPRAAPAGPKAAQVFVYALGLPQMSVIDVTVGTEVAAGTSARGPD